MPKLKSETITARKTRILRAALVCFADHGYHQTTMDDIAMEAGLSKGGLYVHFQSKKELFLALYDWFISEFNFFSISSSKGMDARERLESIVDNMVMTVSSDDFGEVSTLMTDVWAQNSHDQDINKMVMRLYTQVRGPLSDLIQEGIADGTFKQVDATAMASIFIATFEGLLIQAMIDDNAVNWDAVHESFNLIINALMVDQVEN